MRILNSNLAASVDAPTRVCLRSWRLGRRATEQRHLFAMHMLRLLMFLLLGISAPLAADMPPSAVVTNWQKGTHVITASVRSNGCTLELHQITNSRNPELKGYWIQHVYAGDKHILQIEHSAVHKEQSLAIDPETGYAVGELDTKLDGKYDLFVVGSVTNQTLVDILFLTDQGWLRHSTPEEFRARQRIGEQNRRDMEELEKQLHKAAQDAMKGRK